MNTIYLDNSNDPADMELITILLDTGGLVLVERLDTVDAEREGIVSPWFEAGHGLVPGSEATMGVDPWIAEGTANRAIIELAIRVEQLKRAISAAFGCARTPWMQRRIGGDDEK